MVSLSLWRGRRFGSALGCASAVRVRLFLFDSNFLSFIKFIYNQMQNRVPSILGMNYLYVNSSSLSLSLRCGKVWLGDFHLPGEDFPPF